MIEVNPSDFTKIVVGVDPAVTSGENADETGIVVVAAGPHQPDTCVVRHCEVHGYVLEDASLPAANKNSIERWAQRVVRAYDEWNANIVVIESNQGHELLESVMRTIRPMMPINRPNARYSKKARAEPIVALYEQGRIHHVGPPEQFADLEEQMTTWVPPAPGTRGSTSPDRVDALVWALTELNLQGRRIVPNMAGGIAPIGFFQNNDWRL